MKFLQRQRQLFGNVWKSMPAMQKLKKYAQICNGLNVYKKNHKKILSKKYLNILLKFVKIFEIGQSLEHL